MTYALVSTSYGWPAIFRTAYSSSKATMRSPRPSGSPGRQCIVSFRLVAQADYEWIPSVYCPVGIGRICVNHKLSSPLYKRSGVAFHITRLHKNPVRWTGPVNRYPQFFHGIDGIYERLVALDLTDILALTLSSAPNAGTANATEQARG